MRLTKKLLGAVLDSLDSQVAVLDTKGRVVYVNQAWVSFARENGVAADFDWLASNYLAVCQAARDGGDADGAVVCDGLCAVVSGQSAAFEYEYPCHGSDVKRWFMMRVVPLAGVAGHFVVSHHNITSRKLAEARIEDMNHELARLSVTDALTGLSNRLRLDEVLLAELYRAARYDSVFSVILLDVDNFKAINDRHGHPVGDSVLVGIAHILHAGVRSSDVAGRWGGEEFLLILPECDNYSAQRMAEKLRREIAEREFPPAGPQTCSFGVATYSAGETFMSLVARADVALYRAKQAGRNRVEVEGVF